MDPLLEETPADIVALLVLHIASDVTGVTTHLQSTDSIDLRILITNQH